jgi:hypothetical protein
MYEIKKAVSGAPWWCLFFNGILLETTDRRWQAVEAVERYKRMQGGVL